MGCEPFHAQKMLSFDPALVKELVEYGVLVLSLCIVDRFIHPTCKSINIINKEWPLYIYPKCSTCHHTMRKLNPAPFSSFLP